MCIRDRYTAQIDALQAENFTLHQQLARSADALAEMCDRVEKKLYDLELTRNVCLLYTSWPTCCLN